MINFVLGSNFLLKSMPTLHFIFLFLQFLFDPFSFCFHAKARRQPNKSNVRLMAEIGSDSDKERVNIILRSYNPG